MKRAFSLPELVVAMALAAIVSFLLFAMAHAGFLMSERFLGEEMVFRRAYVISNRLAAQIHETDVTLASYSPDGTFVAYPSARSNGQFVTNATSGKPVWSGLQLLYVQPHTSNLRLRELGPEWTVKLPIAASQLVALCDGSGEMLSDAVSSLNVTVETVEVANDPIVSNVTVPAEQTVAALLHVQFTLKYKDRRSKEMAFPFSDKFEGWNSFDRSAPAVPAIPTATPTPPNTMPAVPGDWSNS